MNVNSVSKRLDELSMLLQRLPVDIVAIQETKLAEGDRPPSVPGFTWHGWCRPTRSGGVGFFIKDSVDARPQVLPDLGSPEVCAVNVRTRDNGLLTIYSVYVPPLSDPGDISDLRRLPNPNSSILLGDFNAHHPDWSRGRPNPLGRSLDVFCGQREFSVFGFRDTPTLLNTRGTLSSPDIVLAGPRAAPLVAEWRTLDSIGSDHLPVLVTVSTRCMVSDLRDSHCAWRPHTLDKPDFQRILSAKLHQWQLSHPVASFQPSAAFHDWCSVVLRVTEVCCRKARRTTRQNKRWMTDEILSLIRRRNSLRRRIARAGSVALVRELQDVKRELQRQIRLAKKLDLAWACRSTTPATYHLLLRRFRVRPLLPAIVGDGHGASYSSDQSIADNMLPFFSRIGSPTHSRNPNLPPPTQPLLDPEFSSDITAEEVQRAISRLRRRKAPGLDGVWNFMLIDGGPGVRSSLLYLFRACWSRGVIPSSWNAAEIRPIPKLDLTRMFGEFRPISLLSVVSKLYDWIVARRLQAVAERHNWLPIHQTGFRSGRNPIEHLIRLQQDAHTAFRNRQILLVAFLDIMKAYDSVHRGQLLRVLANLGVGGRMLSFLRATLGDRRARVRYRNSVSAFMSFPNGLPQGSPLSPILYVIFSAPALVGAGPDVAAAADDMKISAVANSLASAQSLLQYRLRSVHQWASDCHQRWNRDKCVVLTISRRRRLAAPTVLLGGVPLLPKDVWKYLGVFVDNSLSWRHNTKETFASALKRLVKLEQIGHSAQGARAAVVSTAFRSTLRPKLEYASVVWGDLSQASAALLDSIQHRSLVRVLGVNRISHRSDVCVESDVPPLSVRRQVQLLLTWRRLSVSPSPLYHHLLSLPARDRLKETHRASFLERLTRLCSRLNLTLAQAQQLSNSDLSRISRELWDLSFQAAVSDTRHRHFKHLQPASHPQHPALRSTLPRFSASIFHGLRLASAPLNSFLNSIGCSRTPLCECGDRETVSHYLLHCRRYRTQRATLRTKVRLILQRRCNLNLRILLANPHDLKRPALLRISRAVCEFISTSRRFTRRRRP